MADKFLKIVYPKEVDDELYSKALHALTELCSWRIRSQGYDPDHGGPEDAAEAFAEKVLEQIMFEFADGMDWYHGPFAESLK